MISSRSISQGRALFYVFGVLCLLGTSARADIVIDVGDHLLLPNTANQSIAIDVSSSNSMMVRGVSLNVQIADGGLAGGIVGPSFQSVDLITGTIFQSSNQGQNSSLETDNLQIWELITSNAQPDVEANGRLVNLVVDTTGFSSGIFNLSLGTTRNGSTEFPIAGGTEVPTITDGRIIISAVPEPGSTGLIATGFVALVSRRRRSKIAK